MAKFQSGDIERDAAAQDLALSSYLWECGSLAKKTEAFHPMGETLAGKKHNQSCESGSEIAAKFGCGCRFSTDSGGGIGYSGASRRNGIIISNGTTAEVRGGLEVQNEFHIPLALFSMSIRKFGVPGALIL